MNHAMCLDHPATPVADVSKPACGCSAAQSPCEEQTETPLCPSAQPACECTEQRPLVLIVDDDPDFLLQHRTHFEALGFEALTADGESAAAELLEQRTPDLAVVDLMMQQSDGGFTLCHELKRRHPSLPVIMVTSAGSLTGYDFQSLGSGQRDWIQADAVLAKPIRFEQLQREVNRLLDPARGSASHSEADDASPQEPATST